MSERQGVELGFELVANEVKHVDTAPEAIETPEQLYNEILATIDRSDGSKLTWSDVEAVLLQMTARFIRVECRDKLRALDVFRECWDAMDRMEERTKRPETGGEDG